jgi:hypothetical protein
MNEKSNRFLADIKEAGKNVCEIIVFLQRKLFQSVSYLGRENADLGNSNDRA